MAGADDPPRNAEHVAKPEIEAVGQHDQPCRDFLVIGQHELLALRTVGNGDDLAMDRLDIVRDLRPHRVDQRVVHDAVLVARLPGDDIAEAGFPHFAVEGRCAQGGIGQTRLAQQGELAPKGGALCSLMSD